MKANTNHHFQDSHEKKAEHQHFADTIASKVNDLIHDRKSDQGVDPHSLNTDELREAIGRQDTTLQESIQTAD